MMTSLKRTVICLVLMLPCMMTASAKVYLVSVGISDYPGTVNDLTLPVADARTMTWLFSKNGDVVYSQLLDSKATRGKIIDAMNRVYAKAGKDDVVVLFYSGHGYQGGFYTYDGELDFSAVRKSMSLAKSRRKFIFADSCFSGMLRPSGHGSTAQSEISAARKAEVVLFLSSRSDETSRERPGMKNGFFTTYLQKGLRGGADADRDRKITACELYEYVSSNVISISKGKQHPVMWGRFPDDMVIMNWR